MGVASGATPGASIYPKHPGANRVNVECFLAVKKLYIMETFSLKESCVILSCCCFIDFRSISGFLRLIFLSKKVYLVSLETTLT